MIIEEKKYYARLYILEILFENKKKLKLIYSKDKKKIIDESEKLFKFKCITKKIIVI
jgi:hypothetical protein